MSAQFRVLVTDPLDKDGIAILKESGKIEVLEEKGLKGDELKARLNEVDGLIVRSGTTVTADLLEGNTRLKVIGRAGVGVDNVDVPAATKIGAVVMNTPGGNAETTAEHAIALMFSAARRIPMAYEKIRQGTWDRKTYVGTELCNKTLGVVGLGNVGKLVAERGLGLKMKVVGFDPFVTKERAEEMGITLMELPELFKVSDVVTIHVPLMEKTRGLLSRPQMETMKKTAIIINCARGGIVNEKDLDQAIRDGIIAGAACDVFEEEPLPKDHPFVSNDKIVLTPHLGASTVEAQYQVAVDVAVQVVDFLIDGQVRNAVNAPSVTKDSMEVLRPFMELSLRLGRCAAQIHSSNVKKITVLVEGALAKEKLDPITAQAVTGVLSTALESSGRVNAVNSVKTAQEKGIHVTLDKSTVAHNFVSTITVIIDGDGKPTRAQGAIFGKTDIRLVALDDFILEAVRPFGHAVVTRSTDKPGMIGRIGSLYGNLNVNVSQMTIGRTDDGTNQAIAFTSLDSFPGDAVIQALKTESEISYVQHINFE